MLRLLLNQNLRTLILLMIVAFVGCSRQATPAQQSVAGSEETPAENASSSETRLAGVGEPDNQTRKVNGITVVGSELTDAHVAAIRRLTDGLAPANTEMKFIRNIQHVGPNKAVNIWQSKNFESYQSLVLVDGIWEVETSGGGLGTF